MFRLRSGLVFFLFVIIGLFLGLGLGDFLGSSFLLGRGLLLWGLILDGLVDEFRLPSYSGKDGLVEDRLIPAGDIGILLAPFLVKNLSTQNSATDTSQRIVIRSRPHACPSLFSESGELTNHECS